MKRAQQYIAFYGWDTTENFTGTKRAIINRLKKINRTVWSDTLIVFYAHETDFSEENNVNNEFYAHETGNDSIISDELSGLCDKNGSYYDSEAQLRMIEMIIGSELDNARNAISHEIHKDCFKLEQHAQPVTLPTEKQPSDEGWTYKGFTIERGHVPGIRKAFIISTPQGIPHDGIQAERTLKKALAAIDGIIAGNYEYTFAMKLAANEFLEQRFPNGKVFESGGWWKVKPA